MAEVSDTDVRLDDRQRQMMGLMMDQGIDEREAKLKVMCIAIPPDHYKSVPGGGAFPRMMYHTDGRNKIVKSATEGQKASADGFGDTPAQSFIDKAQGVKPEPLEPEFAVVGAKRAARK